MERDLRPLFFPDSVTVVGASTRPESLPGAVLRNLQKGHYPGRLTVVHPSLTEVFGVAAYPGVEALPEAPEMAVLGVAPDAAETSLLALLERGTRAFILLTAGFGEMGAAGRAREEALALRCRERGAVLLGSNCVGLHAVTEERRLDASFVRAQPRPGRIALICQSGSVGEWFFLRMLERQVGVALFASLGNMADLDVADLIRGTARLLPHVRQVLLYLETVPPAARLRAALAELPPECRLFAVRGGTTPSGGRAVAGHTGSLAAEPRLAEAMLAAAGVQEVYSLTEAIDLMEAVDKLPPPRGKRVAVITNAGGPAVLATDELSRRGISIPELSRKVRDPLASALAPAAVTTNPVDLLAAAAPEAYRHALAVLAKTDEVDALLPMFMHPIVTSAEGVGRAMVEACRAATMPALVCWMPSPEAAATEALFRDAGLPVINEPTRAAAALAGWANLRVRDGAPWRDPLAAARAWPTAGRLGDSTWGDPVALEAFLTSPRVGTPGNRRARTRGEAEAAAREIGVPLALKLERGSAPHKGKAGLLALARQSDGLTIGLERLSSRAEAGDRWLVQKLVSGKLEMYLGFLRHPVLGSFIGLGRGGGHIEDLEPPIWLSLPAAAAAFTAFLRRPSFVPELGGVGDVGFEALTALVSAMAALDVAAPGLVMAEVNPAVWDSEQDRLWLVDARWQMG